ncbi:flagellar basal body-associated FliL family protein [Sphingorhabdus sp.]|uniref:flagellar basal body-associated FliL family protein n=1 Tax=Sphingorhabdus sp. TaxID=1902408 RepID=UPI00391A97F0
MSKAKSPEPGSKPKKGKKKIIVGTVAAVALVGAGAATGVYLAGGITGQAPKVDPHRPKLVERSEEPEPPAAEGEGAAPVLKEGTVDVENDRVPIDPRKYEVTYVNLEQSFTANLADGAGFVQLGLSLSTYYDGKVVQNIQRQSVPIRSAILMVLSQQDAEALSTPQGKQLLQRDLTTAINQVLRQKEGFGGVDNVYFSNLVIQ